MKLGTEVAEIAAIEKVLVTTTGYSPKSVGSVG